MGTVAVLMGGMVATLISLIAVFVGGVNWSTGLMIYFASGLGASVAILAFAMVARKSQRNKYNSAQQELAA